MKSTISRRLLLLVVASCLLSAHASSAQLLEERKPQLQVRQISSAPQSGAATTPTPASTIPTPTTTPPSATPSAQTTSTTPTTTSTTPTTTPQTTTTQPTTSQSSTSHDTTTTQPPTTLPVTTSEQVFTNSLGQASTSTIVYTPSASSSTPSSSQTTSSDSSSGLGTGSIIGLSVAGGVAVIAIISFFVWKFTRKRFTDFDDNEAIKWPELNTHGPGGSDVHALPTNSTGRSGFGTEHDSELNLARAPSPGGYAHSVAAASIPETYSTTHDPYAVPPLPHLNPNQPYHDDPGAYNQPGYYDPYRGPVPNTLGDGFSDGHGTEAIPMTRMARTRSPGPQMGYDVQGRASPGPQAAMGYGLDARSGSPAIGAGRASPGPQAVYGYGPR